MPVDQPMTYFGFGSMSSKDDKAKYAGNSSNASIPIRASASSTAAAQPKKPTRPLTAYHLYFQLEREYILQTTQGDEGDADDSIKPDDYRPIGKQIDPDMPYRYRYIHMSPVWYMSGSGKRRGDGKNQPKRKHRKTHGKISFLDLSKCIASRWANLEETDSVTKKYVQDIAARELKIYKRDMALFKASVALKMPETSAVSSGDGGFRYLSSVGAGTLSLESATASASMQMSTSALGSMNTQMALPSANASLGLQSSAVARAKPEEGSSNTRTKDALADHSFHPVSGSELQKHKKNRASPKMTPYSLEQRQQHHAQHSGMQSDLLPPNLKTSTSVSSVNKAEAYNSNRTTPAGDLESSVRSTQSAPDSYMRGAALPSLPYQPNLCSSFTLGFGNMMPLSGIPRSFSEGTAARGTAAAATATSHSSYSDNEMQHQWQNISNSNRGTFKGSTNSSIQAGLETEVSVFLSHMRRNEAQGRNFISAGSEQQPGWSTNFDDAIPKPERRTSTFRPLSARDAPQVDFTNDEAIGLMKALSDGEDD